MSRRDSSKKRNPIQRDKERYEAYCKRQGEHVDLGAPSIYYPGRDAVVTIYTSTLLSAGYIHNTVATGFFIDPKTILTAAHNVFLPSFDGEEVNRTVPPPVDPVTGASAPNVQRVDSIRVTISNVNYCGDTCTYDAILIGTALSLDIAVLKIPQIYSKPCSVPILQKHDVLKFSLNHCGTVVGEDVFIIGSSGNTESTGLSRGMVLDDLYSDNLLRSTGYGYPDRDRGNGFWAFECLMIDGTVTPGNSGSPVLNAQGEVVGMVIGIDSSAGFVARFETPIDGENDAPPNVYPYSLQVPNYASRVIAITSRIIQRVVKAILDYPNDKCLNGHIQEISDPYGNFLRYKYGYLGIQGFEAYNPEFFHYVPEPSYRNQKGFVITEAESSGPIGQMVNLYTGFQYPQAPNPIPVGGVNGDILLITELQGVPMGVGPGQFPFTSVTYATIEGMTLQVNYRLGSEEFQCARRSFIVTAYYPLDLDNIPRYTNTVSSSIKEMQIKSLRSGDSSRGLGDVAKLLSNPQFLAAVKQLLGQFATVADKTVKVVKAVGQEVEDIMHIVKGDEEVPPAGNA